MVFCIVNVLRDNFLPENKIYASISGSVYNEVKKSEHDSIEIQNSICDNIDTIIKNIIIDKFKERKIEGKLCEPDSCNFSSSAAKVQAFEYICLNLVRTKFIIYKESFESEVLAKEEMKLLQTYRKKTLEEPGYKFSFFTYRINKYIYSISSTENISHVRTSIYKQIQHQFNISQDNAVVY